MAWSSSSFLTKNNLLTKHNLRRLAIGAVAAYLVMWIASFCAFSIAVNDYRTSRQRSDDATFLVVYTQFHIKSLPAQQRHAIHNPTPPHAPDHMVDIPRGRTIFVWQLLSDRSRLEYQAHQLDEYSSNAVTWVSQALYDATPIQYFRD